MASEELENGQHQMDTERVAMMRGGGSEPRTSLKVLYFFAGVVRKGDIRSFMKTTAESRGWSFIMEEIDLLRGGSEHDLSQSTAQNHWIDRIQDYDIIICTPPCCSHSRATWANSFGPHPVRSAQLPDGYPWLSNADMIKCRLFSGLVTFMWNVMRRVHDLQHGQDIIAFAEHPEDLGRIKDGSARDIPAFIWRSTDFLDLNYGLVVRGLSTVLLCRTDTKTNKVPLKWVVFQCNGHW